MAARSDELLANSDATGAPDTSPHRRGITDWNPEDPTSWAAGNSVIARRNLLWSTITMHVAFSIWSLWSVVVLFMPESVYGLTPGDKLLLGAIATLVGGCARIPYTIANTALGGRTWAACSTLILLVPTAATLALIAEPGRPLWMYAACAAGTGLGGGNYAAALANVNAFYPQRLKGVALGVAGGFGNLGVAAIQLVGLLVLTVATGHRAYWVCAIYLALLAITGVGAAWRMDNLQTRRRRDAGGLRSILRVPDTWVIALLYSATFGSFIGFAFAFVQVLHVNFAAAGHSADQAALHTAEIAFLGPLLAALARIYGGRLADRHGGGRVTAAVFAAMIAATGLLVAASTFDDHSTGPVSTPTLTCYIGAFLALFWLAGMGNGSIMKLIPSIFERRSRTLYIDATERQLWARSRSGALIGFATAVGALGGAGIDLALRQAYLSSGTETPAFWVFLAAYVIALTLTWTVYARRRRETPARKERQERQ